MDLFEFEDANLSVENSLDTMDMRLGILEVALDICLAVICL